MLEHYAEYILKGDCDWLLISIALITTSTPAIYVNLNNWLHVCIYTADIWQLWELQESLWMLLIVFHVCVFFLSSVWWQFLFQIKIFFTFFFFLNCWILTHFFTKTQILFVVTVFRSWVAWRILVSSHITNRKKKSICLK